MWPSTNCKMKVINEKISCRKFKLYISNVEKNLLKVCDCQNIANILREKLPFKMFFFADMNSLLRVADSVSINPVLLKMLMNL